MLNSARHNYYQGNLDQAIQTLENSITPTVSEALFLLERATIQQTANEYEKSAETFLAAAETIEKLEAYSRSKGTASLVINDSVQNFRGTPYERTLMHCFAAKNYLALSDWDDAAVEARRIIWSLRPEKLNNYPADAYSRYIAGLCLELIGDDSNASLQYKHADALAKDITINHKNGRLGKAQQNTAYDSELVCLILLGRSPSSKQKLKDNQHSNRKLYGEIYSNNEYLGRSYALTDTLDLALATQEVEAKIDAVKTATRVAAKEAIASPIENESNVIVGEIARMILIGVLEEPDARRWETLPRWLEVARVPCPSDLTKYEVVIKNEYDVIVNHIRVDKPLTKRGKLFVSFCRDLPGANKHQ